MIAFLITVARKVGFFISVLLGVSFAIILLGRMVPGDAIDQLSDDPEFRAAMVQELGLDKPVIVQYVSWLGDAAQGDLGESWVLRQGEPVANLIGPALVKTASLVVPSLFLTFLFASLMIALTHYDGVRPVKLPLKVVTNVISVLPLFLMGELVIVLFNSQIWPLVEAGTIARPGWFALPGETHWFKYFLATLVLSVGNGTLSDLILHLDEEFDKVRHQEFVLSAWARGARSRLHIVLNLLVPVFTLVVNKLAFLLGGAVVVETVFNINGVGSMIWRAAEMRDIPVVIAISFVLAAVVVLMQLLSDLLQVIVDPRVRA